MRGDGRPGRTHRRDRRFRAVRRPVVAAARGGRPHLRRGGLRRGRAGPPPGPDRLGIPRDHRRRGRPSWSTARSARGSRAGTSSARSRSSSGRRRSPTWSRPGRCAASSSAGPRVEPFLIAHPQGDVPDAPGAGTPSAGREPMAELTGPAAGERPHPPGDYPVVVIGSGPGGLQAAYSLGRLGIDHAVISADPVPGGMFRRWPFFQRLLSWTKPHAPAERGSRAYERYDWNSLLGDDPTTRALQPEFMDGTSYFPSRPEMEANLAAFAERSGLAVRYGCRWTATRLEDGDDGRRFVVETTDGEYRAALPDRRGRRRRTEHAAGPGHGAHPPLRRRPPGGDATPGKRVFIIGKQNSGFELANGLLPWARQLVLASPSTARLSVDTRSLVGVRARYVQPYEDNVLGGGVAILDAAIERIEPVPGGDGALAVHRAAQRWRRRARGRGRRGRSRRPGSCARCMDLPALGVATFGREPAAGPDAVVGEHHGARDLLRRHDRAGRARASSATASPATRGRSTGRATTRGCSRAGSPRPSSVQSPDRPRAGERRTRRPGHGRAGRCARAVAPARLPRPGHHGRPGGGPGRRRCPATQPRPGCGRPGRPGAHASRPMARARSIRCSTRALRGTISERMLDPDPLLRYDGPDARRVIGEVVRTVVPEAVAARPRDRARQPVARRERQAGRGRLQRLAPLREREAQLRPPELGAREERRPGHGGDTGIADQAQSAKATSSSSVRSRMSVIT